MKKILFLFLLISKVYAGGLYLYEVGIPDNGWAAAGRPAYVSDPSTVYSNPAGLSNLKNSEIMIGLQPKYAILDFNNDSTPTSNDINLSAHFPGASIFYTTNLSKKVGFGFGILSFMGLAIDYGNYWEGKNWIQKSSLITLDLVPAFSYKFSDNFSLGLGLDILMGGLDQQFGDGGPTSDSYIKYKDSQVGFGFNLGLLYHFSDDVRLGIKWRSPVGLDFEAAPTLNNGTTLSNLKMDMTIPQEVSLGLYIATSEKFSLLFGFDWQNWMKFGEFSLANNNGQTIPINANLQNTWNISGGFIWSVGDIEKLTVGLAYDSSAVTDANRTVMLPVSGQFRFSWGYMVEFSNTRMFDLNLTFITSGNDTTVNMAQGSGFRPAIKGKYDPYDIFVIGANYSWKL